MSCSTLPLGQSVFAAAASRISWSWFLVSSPLFQRRLQRGMSFGIGLAARHAPFAYSKKSLQGSTFLSMSPTSKLFGSDRARPGQARTRRTRGVARMDRLFSTVQRLGVRQLLSGEFLSAGGLYGSSSFPSYRRGQ